MLAIYKREMRSYFTTPIGYIFTAVFLAISGFIFSISTFHSATTDVSGYTQIMLFGYILLLPLLTMRSFAEERRLKTEQVLMTSPVSLFGMVFAKFLAAYTMFAGTVLVSCFYFIPVARLGSVNYPKTFGCLIAMMLVGLCFVSVGIFVSALTESQMTAAVATVLVLLVFVGASLFNGLIDSQLIKNILSWISVYSRFNNFTYGIFDTAGALYYLSVTGVFLFLSVRVYERRRWA